MNFYDGPFPDGVPNPWVPMLHSYPTRYHGPIYTRPMFNLPFVARPYDFVVPEGMEGLGAITDAFKAPKSEADCDASYPMPETVTDAATFAAYAQNQACREHARASRDSRRWLLGLTAAFVVGVVLGKRKK